MKKRGQSLVGVLVGVAIVILLAIAFTVGSGAFGGKTEARPDGKGNTVIGRSMYRAKDEACRSNLSQLRQSIQINTDPVENTPPAQLSDTKLGADFMKCPVGGENYVYDAKSGAVSCPHPGHEKY